MDKISYLQKIVKENDRMPKDRIGVKIIRYNDRKDKRSYLQKIVQEKDRMPKDRM